MIFKQNFQTIEELSDQVDRSAALRTIADRRKKIRIGIVDDNKFVPYSNLRNLGYNLEEVSDVKTISELADFSIILCDLMGVGASFGAKDEGVQIIREIRKSFPTKYVIAYTGSSMRTSIVSNAKQVSDDLVKKDIDTREWQELLDKYVDLSSDPIESWRRFRVHLVENGINTFLLLKVEDAFVRSFRQGDANFKRVLAVVSEDQQGASWLPLVKYFAANAVFKLLIEGVSSS
ncbi:MAG: response regulator [Hyphomonadaceae bacterium]|nr:response regulator [Hyphomonadaceae bacterium]